MTARAGPTKVVQHAQRARLTAGKHPAQRGDRDMRAHWTLREIANDTGYSERWVLRQIELHRLVAVAFDAGGRRSYRVSDASYRRFRDLYFRDARELPRRDEE